MEKLKLDLLKMTLKINRTMNKYLVNCFLAFFILSLSININAQADADTSLIRNNPYEVVYNHLYNLQTDSYNPDKAAISFPAGTPQAVDLAIQLKQILDGKGIYLDLNRIPTDPEYRDTTRNESIYMLDKRESRIYVEKLNGNWVYSRTTVNSIPAMYEQLFPFGTQFFSYFSAPSWQVKILGVELWKWLGIIILLALAYAFFVLVRIISRLFIGRFLRNKLELTDYLDKTMFSLSKVLAFLLAIRFVIYFLPMFQIEPKINAGLLSFLNVFSLFFIIIALKFVIKIVFVYFEKVSQITESTMDDQLMPVLYKLSMIILWSLGIVYIMDYLGVNITALIAGLSIGGLALALAAQDTVKNFFGSVMIFLDKPFQIGDLIQFDGTIGSVEEVGVRSTRIRTPQNSLTYIPNAKLADSVINNLGLRVFRRFDTQLGVTYDTRPDMIEAFVEGIKEIILSHPLTVKENFQVHLNSFADSSLNIFVLIFFDTQDWSVELKSRHEIMISLIKLANGLGVRFAFPTQTLHIEELPNSGSSNTPAQLLPENAKENKNQLMEEIRRYFEERNTPQIGDEG